VSNQANKPGSDHEYPPVWEKVVPIALWVLGGIVAILILLIFAVALGILPRAA
jgi:hypothetical protein